MAMTPEAKVKKSVIALLRQYKVYYFFPATHGMGRSGIPDIVCCLKGEFLAIECKAGMNQPTALQQREIDAINGAGGIAYVVRETDMAWLEGFLKLKTYEDN